MTSEKKMKLFYSGELILIAIVFIVIASLEISDVMHLSKRFMLIFKIVTLVGATWLVTDFVWTLLSPRKRAKNCLMDKVMMLPLALYLYIFDIIGLATKQSYDYYRFGIPGAFYYIALVYSIQGVYHYYHPVPAIIEVINEEKAEAENKELEAIEEKEDENK